MTETDDLKVQLAVWLDVWC